jgi:hypothetical protein
VELNAFALSPDPAPLPERRALLARARAGCGEALGRLRRWPERVPRTTLEGLREENGQLSRARNDLPEDLRQEMRRGHEPD